MFMIHKEQHSQYNFISFFFISKLMLFEQSNLLFINKHNFSFFNSLYYDFFIFPIFCKCTTQLLEFWYLL